MTHVVVQLDTVVGPLSLRWDDEVEGVDAHGGRQRGAIVRAAFMRAAALADEGDVVVEAEETSGPLKSAVTALQSWSSGADLNACDSVPVAQPGGDFRQRCWHALRSVRAGEVVTYAELAELAGSPGASRAAGGAMANNAIAPIVPCHRVVPASGGLGNYSAARGPLTKAALLAHERAI